MEAEIRYLLTPDIDPGTFMPEDPGSFMFLVQMIAGPAGEEGEESFSFEVCTPGWLQEQARAGGPVSGRHRVIVGAFGWPALQRYFELLVSRRGDRDWHQTAVKLGRYGQWEFEDCDPGPGARSLPPGPACCCGSRGRDRLAGCGGRPRTGELRGEMTRLNDRLARAGGSWPG